MKNILRFISVLLVALTFSILLISCSVPGDNPSAETTVENTSPSDETKTKADMISDYLSSLPEEQFEGAEVSFLVASETL